MKATRGIHSNLLCILVRKITNLSHKSEVKQKLANIQMTMTKTIAAYTSTYEYTLRGCL